MTDQTYRISTTGGADGLRVRVSLTRLESELLADGQEIVVTAASDDDSAVIEVTIHPTLPSGPVGVYDGVPSPAGM
jgi:hypothetical protein